MAGNHKLRSRDLEFTPARWFGESAWTKMKTARSAALAFAVSLIRMAHQDLLKPQAADGPPRESFLHYTGPMLAEQHARSRFGPEASVDGEARVVAIKPVFGPRSLTTRTVPAASDFEDQYPLESESAVFSPVSSLLFLFESR
jgi:hypothetical protein